jgi:dGTPase
LEKGNNTKSNCPKRMAGFDWFWGPMVFQCWPVVLELKVDFEFPCNLRCFYEIPKESLLKTNKKDIADKKYGFFQTDNLSEAKDISWFQINRRWYRFERHPLAYLVEAADDICYTIIDFEDGKLGSFWRFALEYLIKLVKDSIDTSKYKTLTTKEDRISYLRALAIGD